MQYIINPQRIKNNTVMKNNYFYFIGLALFLMPIFIYAQSCNDLDVLSVQDGEICGSGVISLEATVSGTGDDTVWFDSAMGGTIMGYGTTFQTPVITSTTSYWVAEVLLDGITFTGQGKTTYSSTSSYTPSNANHFGLSFTATESFTIVDVVVFSTGNGGSLQVDLRQGDYQGPIIETATVTVAGGGSLATPVSSPITLNFDVPAAGTYYISASNGPSMIREFSDGNFPYALGTVGQITSGHTYTGFYGDTYYFFYNWTISTESVDCESDREEVVAVVHPLPSAQQPDPLVICDVDGTGYGFFDLNSAIPQIIGGNPTLIVTFHGTLSDAEGGYNPVTNPYQNTTNPETLYVRVEDPITGCYVILTLDLIVNPQPDMDQMPDDLFSNNGTGGIATFDLTVNESLMLGTQNPADFEFTYFESYPTNPIIITDPTAYQNISNPQTIYVTMGDLNTDCFAEADFEIEVNTLSLDSNDFNAGVILYPNPTDGPLNIMTTSQLPFSVEVYSILGELLNTTVVNTESGTIDLSCLSAGTYFIKLTAGTQQAVKNVVKK
jgi:hypothetical protein